MKRAVHSSPAIVPEELVQSEEGLRFAADAADLFAWELNLKNNTLKWSQNAAHVIGCAQTELTSDPSQRDFFIVLADRAKVSAVYKDAIATGSDIFDVSFRGREGDIERAFWRTRGSIIRNGVGVPIRVIAATQNITTRKNAEEELRLVAERLATAEAAAGALIYDWDLKTGVV